MEMAMLSIPSVFAMLLQASIAFSKHENDKCLFEDTVDLSGRKPLDNGSYLYNNMLIPANKVAMYNYSLRFNNVWQSVEPHMRACVCGDPRYCVKVCCEWGEFFSVSSYTCERIPEHLNMPSALNIVYENGSNKSVNIFEYFVYQVGVPCSFPRVLSLDDDEWHLMVNGLLYSRNDDELRNTLKYCLNPFRYEGANQNVLVPMACPMDNHMLSSAIALHTYAPVVALVFLVPTIIVYLWLKELRENIRGKILICYLISLINHYIIISFINISALRFGFGLCNFLAFTGYFFFMASFLWLSVLCFDMWIYFKDYSALGNPRRNRIRFKYYTLYAWGSASLLTALAMGCQWSKHVPEVYKLGVGVDICWLDTTKWSAAIYCFLPNTLILIFSLVTFAHLSLHIYRVRRDVAEYTQKESFFRESAVVVLRIFIILGVSGIVDMLSYFFQNSDSATVLFIVADFHYAIHGILVFVLFVLKRSVRNSLRQRFCPLKNAPTTAESIEFTRGHHQPRSRMSS